MNETGDITSRAMLVSLTISRWTGNVTDKVVSNEVVRNKCATADAGLWRTRLLPKDAMKEIQQKATLLYQIHTRYTLPWNDGGTRILPSKLYDKYKESLAEAERQFNDAVERFLDKYPRYLSEAPARLGQLADTLSLPSLPEVRTKFGVDYTILPMPRADDFRVALGDERGREAKERVERSIAQMTSKAVKSLWEQLAALVGRIEKTLGEKDKVFRDSLIRNLQDFVDTLPSLNITNDPDLERIRVECVASLAKLKPDSLRKQPATRKKAADAAKNILESIRKIDLDLE